MDWENYAKIKKHRQAGFQKITCKNCFYILLFFQTSKKIELTSLSCLSKPEYHFLASQLPNLGCYCHWKSLNLRNFLKTFKVRLDEVLRNIEAQAKRLVSFKIRRVV